MVDRISNLADTILKELVDFAGSREYSSLYPGAEVIDAAYDAGPPARILVRGRDGTYIPALAAPGATYNNGEYVTILYIKGTEPQVLTQSPGSGGSVGGDGWKLGNLIVVSSSGDGDYTTMSAAIAAASSGDTILVDEGSYTCNGETLPTGVDLVGMGVITTTLSTTTSATTLTFNGINYAHNIMIQNFYSSGSITQATQVSGSSVRCYNVRSVAFNSGGGGCRGVLVDSGTQPIMMWSEAQGTVSGGGTGYGLYVNSGDAKLYFGSYIGTDYGVYLNTPSAAVDFGMPACRAISGTDVGVSGGTAPVGWFFNNATGVIQGFGDNVIIMDERASDPSTPPTGSWGLYFKSGGLYHIDDTGSVTGPIT